MRLFLLLAVNILVVLGSHAQLRYAYLPEGKTYFESSTEKFVIRYKKWVPQKQRLSKIADSSSIKRMEDGIWNIVTLQKALRDKDSLAVVLNHLKQDSSILYVAPCLIYKGKMLQGLTDQVLVRLRSNTELNNLSDTFKRLGIQNIAENKYLEREYTLSIDAKGKLDALDIANQLYETGFFEYCGGIEIIPPLGR